MPALASAAMVAQPASAALTTTIGSASTSGGSIDLWFNYRSVGQSVTVNSDYNNLSFSFLGKNDAALATGTLYLFDQWFTGANLALGNSIASANASGGAYTFAADVALAAGKTYYFYTDTPSAGTQVLSDKLDGGMAFFANRVGSPFFSSANQDMAFTLTGLPVAAMPPASAVPEPAAWGLMILGFGAVGGALRRRRAVTTRIRFA